MSNRENVKHLESETPKQKFEGYLPKGTIKKVAEKHKLSIYQVHKVIAGDSENIDVLESLVEIAERTKSVKNRLSNL